MRLDTERLALLDGDVATILGTSWTTLPNTSVVGTFATSQRTKAKAVPTSGADIDALAGCVSRLELFVGYWVHHDLPIWPQ